MWCVRKSVFIAYLIAHMLDLQYNQIYIYLPTVWPLPTQETNEQQMWHVRKSVFIS